MIGKMWFVLKGIVSKGLYNLTDLEEYQEALSPNIPISTIIITREAKKWSRTLERAFSITITVVVRRSLLTAGQ
jgi:hypothetical protein